MAIVKKMMSKFFINFLSPVVHNVLSMVLSSTGERLIEMRTAKELLDGRQIKLITYVSAFLNPLRSIGFPVPEIKIGNHEINNFKFGFVAQRADVEIGPVEHFRRTENGHLFNEVYRFKGERQEFRFCLEILKN